MIYHFCYVNNQIKSYYSVKKVEIMLIKKNVADTTLFWTLHFGNLCLIYVLVVSRFPKCFVYFQTAIWGIYSPNCGTLSLDIKILYQCSGHYRKSVPLFLPEKYDKVEIVIAYMHVYTFGFTSYTHCRFICNKNDIFIYVYYISGDYVRKT